MKPSYLNLLATGELNRRVEALEALLERCTICPRDCLNNRLQNEIAACYSGYLPIVSSYTAHFGEDRRSSARMAREISFLAIAICVVSIARIIRSPKRTNSRSRTKLPTSGWLR